MNILEPAQAGAQLLSLVVFASIAKWYVAPWLVRQPRATALIALLWVHVFRYVALQVYSARLGGFPISAQGAREIVIGDVGGAILAFAAILLLRSRIRFGIAASWLLALETGYDTITNIKGGVREHLMGAASGVTWLTLVFFVPAIVVSAGLLAWQLYSRRGETLGQDHGATGRIRVRAPISHRLAAIPWESI